jgi:hypothetical protein
MKAEIERYDSLGLKLLPLLGKKPLCPWKEGVPLEKTIELVERYRGNIGFITGRSRIVVVDADDDEAIDFLKSLPETPMKAKTSRGIHAYYRAPTELVPLMHGFRGLALDILSQNSYAARREWLGEVLSPNDLPEFPNDLFPKEEPKVTTPVQGIERVRNYIRKITAVSGQGGHNATYRAACKMADAGLTEEQVLAELIVWNETNAFPKWDWKALQHKARDACNRRK